MRTQRVFEIAECTALGRVVPATPALALRGTVLLLTLLVGGTLAWATFAKADLVVRAPARVRARNAPQLAFAASSGERVVAPAAGRVSAIAVHDGQRVTVGQQLATLDTTQLANDLARLEAALVAARDARAMTERMQTLIAEQFEAAQATRRAEIAQVAREEARGRTRRNADIRVAQSAVTDATRELERLQALERDGAASRQQVDQATSRLSEVRARLDAATVAAAGGRTEVLRRSLAQAERDFAVRREELAHQLAQHTAELAAAEQRIANARIEVAKGNVIADAAGVISSMAVSTGDIVQPGQPMFVISPDGGVRVDAAVAASDVGRLSIGMKARMRIDAFDWQRYGTATGVIAQISADAEPLGTGGPLAYTIRIELDREEVGSGELCGRLKLGMTGTVEMITGRERLLSLLLGRLHQAISLGG